MNDVLILVKFKVVKMTGSPVKNGLRRIWCKSSTRLAKTESAADCSQTREQVVGQHEIHERKIRSDPKSKQMYFSDDSSVLYETTISEDERIAQQLREEHEKEKSEREKEDLERREAFDEYFREKSHEIFDLPGLSFLKFTHTKIKFCFEPCKVVTHVKRDLKFYCSLRYYKKYKFWNIRRDSFPLTYKNRIYSIFYGGDFFSVTDNTVANAIFRIYIQLKFWAQEEEEYRMDKFMRYQNGEDIILDTDDEEIFLTEDQIKELHHTRDNILRRMIPPLDAKFQTLPPETPKRRRRKQVISDSD